MSKENFTIRIEHALQALTLADQILEDVSSPEDVDGFEKMAPWEAAQASVCQAMCLLIDTLEGVETVTYSSRGEAIPKRIQPYSYLSAQYATISDRYIDHARGLEDILRDFNTDE